MKRREFSKPVKAEMFRRATVEGTTFCEGCGLALKKWEFDHTIAEALLLDKSRKLTAADGQLLGECCHRGEAGKTNKDVKIIAKAKRQEKSILERPSQREVSKAQDFRRKNASQNQVYRRVKFLREFNRPMGKRVIHARVFGITGRKDR